MNQCARHVRCRRYAMPPPSGGALHGVSHGSRRAERGASLTEFAIVAPVLLLLGLGTVQAGLLYHGKTILNYATFEAARAGATRHAQPEPMRRELAARLAPLYGGDGSEGKAAVAIGRALAESASPLTRLAIVNPTPASFAAWGEESVEREGQRAIPNAHLRHQPDEGAGAGGQTLRDANVLKIEVTVGYELKVPLVGPLLAGLIGAADRRPEHTGYYRSGRLPLKSVATVRMQSEAWSGAIEEAAAAVAASEAESVAMAAEESEGSMGEEGDETGDPLDFVDGEGSEECGANGLPLGLAPQGSGEQSCAGDEPPGGAGTGLPAELVDTGTPTGGSSPVSPRC